MQTTAPSSGSHARTDATGEPEPLHIVEFVDGFGAGGAQALIVLRARNARRMGYRIDLVSLGTGVALLERLSDHVDGVHLFPSRHVFDAGRIMRICTLLRRLKPDVIHTHLRTSNIVGALCGKLSNVPVVATLHSAFPALGMEHARRDWAEKWALRLGTRHIMGVGPGVARTHRPRLGEKRVLTIPNPVELPSDRLDPIVRKVRARASLDLPFDTATARTVLVVGRLTKPKGALDAVQVLARLLRASPGEPATKLLMAGEGALHDELQRVVEADGLGESVFLLGRTERVRELMAASDVMLLSSHHEGLPLVLLEAMSMHLPIVATRVGDVPWLLGDGEFGALVEPGDLDGIAAAVHRMLMLSDGAVRELTDRAFRRAKDVFSAQSWLLDVDRVLRDAAGKGLDPVTAGPHAQGGPSASPVDDEDRLGGSIARPD